MSTVSAGQPHFPPSRDGQERTLGTRLSDGLFVIDNVNGHIFVPQTINHLIIIACPLICIILWHKNFVNINIQGSQQIFKQEVITDKVGGSSAKPEVSKQSKEKRLKHKVSGYKSQSKRRSNAGCRLLLRTLNIAVVHNPYLKKSIVSLSGPSA